MGIARDLIEGRWFPAWDAGDRDRFIEVTREIFAPDCEIDNGRRRFSGLDEALTMWADHLDAFRPQEHRVLWAVDMGEEVAIEYYWGATHAGPFHLPDGTLLQATGRHIEHQSAAIFVRGNGTQIVTLHGHTNSADYANQLNPR